MIKDYSKFSPKEYLKEYYSEDDGELDEFLLGFFHDAYSVDSG